ncbi:MAG: HdeA/HdeB family chaperone [Candidatus Competibacteraceae bacterium]
MALINSARSPVGNSCRSCPPVPPGDAGVVLMWIDGYLSGVSGDTSLNWKDLEKFSTNLVAYCGKPDEKVLDAAEAVGIAE